MALNHSVSIDITDLRSAPQHIPQLAGWHHEQWAELNPGRTLTQRIVDMQAYLGESFVPSTYIAHVDGVLAGSAAIIDCDMDTRADLTPWLASVFVSPPFRRQGVGTRLVRHVMDQARQADVATLYLFTPDQAAFYQRLGWQTLSRDVYRGHQVTLMSVDFD